MTLRTILLSLLLFLLVAAITMVLSIPVQVLVEKAEDYLPEEMQIQSSSGSIFEGSAIILHPFLKEYLPIDWKVCFIDILHPVGFCLSLPVKGIDLRLAVQPWSLGDTIHLFNIRVHSDIGKLATLHGTFSVLSAINGTFSSDIQKISIVSGSNRILDIEGTVQLQETSALGLIFGTVNVSFTNETAADGDSNNIIIAVEGGNIDQIKSQGSGTLTAEGQLDMRFLFRSSNTEIQPQLGIFAKKQSETEYEWSYSGKVF